MLGAIFCILFGRAAAQHFLGDPISVSFDAKTFDKNPPRIRVIEVNVTKFWMEFPAAGSGANAIHFKNMPVVPARENTLTTVTLESDFGTVQKALALPSYVTGMMYIMAEGAVFEIRQTQKVYLGTMNASLLNVTFGRHITTNRSRGVVSTVSNLPKKFDVRLSNVKRNTPANDFVVQLVSMSGGELTMYDSMNVTKVSTSGSVTTLEGEWNMKGAAPKTDLKLLVGIKNGTQPFNTYALANLDAMSHMLSFVLVDNTFKLTAPASIPEYNVTNITVNGGGVHNFWWIIATDKMTNMMYTLNCESQPDTSFQNFEWFVQPIGKKTYPYLPVGTYDLAVAWVPTQTRNSNASVNYPTSATAAMMNVVQHAGMAPTPISFNRNSGQQLGNIQQGQQVKVEVYSVFSKINIQWFRLSPNSNYTNSSNGNDTTGWEAIAGTQTPYPMIPGQSKSLTITVPTAFNLTLSAKARLYGWTDDCNGNHFGQVFVRGNITSPPAPSPSSSGGSTLGPGAIVGIVCAVVFVCGVAAWWLCMRKPGTQDRYQKLEQN